MKSDLGICLAFSNTLFSNIMYHTVFIINFLGKKEVVSNYICNLVMANYTPIYLSLHLHIFSIVDFVLARYRPSKNVFQGISNDFSTGNL